MAQGLPKIIAAMAILALSVTGAAAQQLYKEFDYGTPRSRIEALPGAYVCEGEFLCLPNQTFLEKPVELAFLFHEQSLISIVVSLDGFSDPITEVAVPIFATGDWIPIVIQNAKQGALDLVQARKTHGVEQAKTMTQSFEIEALRSGEISYSLVEAAGGTQAVIDQSGSVQELLGKLPADTRTLDIYASTSEDSRYLVFALPVRTLALLQSKPVEAF